VAKKEKTWLDGIHGWDEAGNVIETCWCTDPAVDIEKSDLDSYMEHLDKSHLVFHKGQKPAKMTVRLPTAAQWGNIQSHLHEVGHATAAIVAFQLCVRFPDQDNAHDELILGFKRLNEKFMMGLTRGFPAMVETVGAWIINRYLLTEEEKKVSSPGSTEKTSWKQVSTTVKNAQKEEKGSKDAQISAGNLQEVKSG